MHKIFAVIVLFVVAASADAGVWLAQTHVQRVGGLPEFAPAEEALSQQVGRAGLRMLRLVGGRDTLLLVDPLDPASSQGTGPLVVKTEVLDANGNLLFSADLVAPTTSYSAPTSLGTLVHDLNASYSVILPAAYIVPGMQLVVGYERLGWAKVENFAIDVGAPTVLGVTMFDFKVFAANVPRLSDSVNNELGWKLPVRRFQVQRVDAPIPRAAIPPQESTVGGVVYKTPWIAATSFTDWATKARAATGISWLPRNNRGVDHSQLMLGALLTAGGQSYIVAMHGNFNDGTTGNFKGRGGSGMVSSSTSSNVLNARGVYAHEFSHNLDLWHWHERPAGDRYPYRGAMFGIDRPVAIDPHCGPVWRWRPPALGDGPRGAFVAPYVTTTTGLRRYRRVISTSGSIDDRATEFAELSGTYSDWDTRVTQEWLEKVIRVWNPELGAWATWDRAMNRYSLPVVGTPGVNLPLDPTPVSVYSVLVAVSAPVPAANTVYKPIGPYNSGLVSRFDPRNPADVTAAAALAGYCPVGGCDYSVRVVQLGVTRVFMLRASATSGAPTSDDALRHVAVNVPASDGAPERIELLATPDAQVSGMPVAPRVLGVWTP